MINPSIFKAYDVRGLYPSEVNEDGRAPDRPRVRELPEREAYRRVARHAAVVAVADRGVHRRRTAQGADVVDYGMMATDMLYFAVARDGHDGGVQITASHNPKQYNGIKMVRRDAFPLSGDEGIGDIRDMIVEGGCRSRPHVRGASRSMNVVDDYVRTCMSFIDPSIVKPFNVVLDAGSGMARSGRAAAVRAPALPDDAALLRDRRHLPEPRSQPAHRRKPARHHRARHAERADIGIAWDGDADRVFFIDGTGEFIAGDFVTALLAEAFLIKHPGAKIVYDVRASYAVKDTVAKYGSTALMNRVGHAFFKRRMREEQRHLRRRGHRPLLFPRQLLLRRQWLHPGAPDPRADVAKDKTLHELLAPLREKVLHLGGDQHACERHGVRAGEDRRARRRSTGGTTYTLDGISAEFPDWHFNVRGSNTEPMLRLNLEAMTPQLMEQKRDEVLAFIRG